MVHAHDHTHSARTQRQLNEAAVYDARAAELAAALTDAELEVDPATPPYPNREHVDFLDRALAAVGDPDGQRILEVGCGSGALAVYLARRGAEVVAVDVSEETLRLARRRAEVNGVADRIRFIDQPVEILTDPDGSYTAVIGNQVLHHLELPVAMPNLRRMLAPGGVAVFCEPVLFLPEIFRRIRGSRAVKRLFPPAVDTPDERSISLEEVRLIAGAFERSRWEPVQLFCRLQNFVDLPDPVFAALERIDRAVLRSVPGAWRLCRYVVLFLEGSEPRERKETNR